MFHTDTKTRNLEGINTGDTLRVHICCPLTDTSYTSVTQNDTCIVALSLCSKTMRALGMTHTACMGEPQCRMLMHCKLYDIMNWSIRGVLAAPCSQRGFNLQWEVPHFSWRDAKTKGIALVQKNGGVFSLWPYVANVFHCSNHDDGILVLLSFCIRGQTVQLKLV